MFCNSWTQMYRDQKNNSLVFSPTDLTRFWESEFVSWMDRFHLEYPGTYIKDADDSMKKVLQSHGHQHEASTIARKTAAGLKICTIDTKSATAYEDTVAAMTSGVDIIYQARLQKAPFSGWADFLIRAADNSGASKLGGYHYEVWDTKLSSKMKPYFILQLAAYAEMLAEVQGVRPEHIGIILGNGDEHRLRLDDYYFYYLEVKQAFLNWQENFDPTKRPDPEAYRQFSHWQSEAKKIITAQDALIQVAHLNTTQAKTLKKSGIMTMTQLAGTAVTTVPRIADAVFAHLKIQAKLQLSSRGKERPDFLIRTENPQAGLYRLPKESAGDVFFDIEGFPLAQDGLEYLWGNTYIEAGKKCFKDFWAHNAAEEKKALEDFIDWVYARWKKHPDMHIYHYANYEIAVLRRLMGRYATKEHQVDQLLRNEVFVDLYAVVRHGLFIGEPRYSIKNIEHLYRGKRQGEVTDGGASVEFYQHWLATQDGKTWEDSKYLKAIREYNIDDCDSTMELVIWLREQQTIHKIPTALPRTYSEAPASEAQDLNELREQLESRKIDFPEAELLSHLTDFYRREDKPMWWKFFDRLAELPEELYYDADCLSGLSAYDTAESQGRKYRRVYAFDKNQESKLTADDKVVHQFDPTKNVEVEDICFDRGFVALSGKTLEHLPDQLTVVPHDYINKAALRKSLLEFCSNWLANPKCKNAVTAFLRRSLPRLNEHSAGTPIVSDEDIINSAIKAVLNMDHATLCIQGPPGTGKTYTAEHLILALVEKGFRIGVTSNSHKAINNLLIRAANRCHEAKFKTGFCKVSSREETEIDEHPLIDTVNSAKDLNITEQLQVIGGTAWAFASDTLAGRLDYLFVDEAGQMSIANLIAVSRATKNIVIMGDQMQLAQPIQGSHPMESGLSVLDYYLQDHPTIPNELGIFLPTSFRMHSDICDFISQAVYENRLKNAPECQKQAIDIAGSKHLVKKTGISFIPVDHEGNLQSSEEECEVIAEIYSDLLGRSYTNSKGEVRSITSDDILIVAPYNLQVRKIQAALGNRARVGSVDKFQGQEAPVVILSMCCSDASNSHRGIEFLFSKNRLNVAISRAQIAAIVVGHPRLAMTHASSVEQIAQINMFCMMKAFAKQ
jgi:predicted RecB family nuclease